MYWYCGTYRESVRNLCKLAFNSDPIEAELPFKLALSLTPSCQASSIQWLGARVPMEMSIFAAYHAMLLIFANAQSEG